MVLLECVMIESSRTFRVFFFAFFAGKLLVYSKFVCKTSARFSSHFHMFLSFFVFFSRSNVFLYFGVITVRGVHQSLGLFCQARLLGNYRQALALGSMSLAAWLLFNVFHERPRANNNFHFRERVLRVFSTEFLRRAKGKSTGIHKPGN